MLVCDYIVESIDGDYAHLRRTDLPEEELKQIKDKKSHLSAFSGKLFVTAVRRRLSHQSMILYCIIS